MMTFKTGGKVTLFVALLALTSLAWAQTGMPATAGDQAVAYGTMFNNLVVAIQKFTTAFGGSLLSAGKTLAISLATLEIMWSSIESITSGGADLEKLFFSLVKKLFVLGMVWAMFSNIWPTSQMEFGGTLVQKNATFLEFIAYNLTALGAEAASSGSGGATGSTPSAMVNTALSVFWHVFSAGFSFVFAAIPGLTLQNALGQLLPFFGDSTNSGIGYLMVMWGIVSAVLLVTSLIASMLLGLSILMLAYQVFATLVEAAIAIPVGLFFLAGGSSRWTHSFMDKAINYAVSVGVKMVVVFALVGVGMGAVDTIDKEFAANIATITATVNNADAQNDVKLTALVQATALMSVTALVGVMLLGLAVKAPSLASSISSGASSLTAGGLASGAAQGVANAAGGAAQAGGAAASAAGAASAIGGGAARGIAAGMTGPAGALVAAASAAAQTAMGGGGASGGGNSGAVPPSPPSGGGGGGGARAGQAASGTSAGSSAVSGPGESAGRSSSSASPAAPASGGGMAERSTPAVPTAPATSGGGSASAGQSAPSSTAALGSGDSAGAGTGSDASGGSGADTPAAPGSSAASSTSSLSSTGGSASGAPATGSAPGAGSSGSGSGSGGSSTGTSGNATGGSASSSNSVDSAGANPGANPGATGMGQGAMAEQAGVSSGAPSGASVSSGAGVGQAGNAAAPGAATSLSKPATSAGSSAGDGARSAGEGASSGASASNAAATTGRNDRNPGQQAERSVPPAPGARKGSADTGGHTARTAATDGGPGGAGGGAAAAGGGKGGGNSDGEAGGGEGSKQVNQGALASLRDTAEALAEKAGQLDDGASSGGSWVSFGDMHKG